MSGKINTLAEKYKLYEIVKKRIEALKKLEESAGGLPVPEMRENLQLAVVILEKIRAEREGRPESSEELKDRLFGDWIARRGEERKRKEPLKKK